jgi:hypothetical protein
MSLMMNVQTSSQKRYVSRCPCRHVVQQSAATGPMVATHLERQPGLNLLRQDVGYRFVEVGEDLHRKLGFDAALSDEVVQRVREGAAYTASSQPRRPESAPRERAVPATTVQLIVLGVRSISGHIEGGVRGVRCGVGAMGAYMG